MFNFISNMLEALCALLQGCCLAYFYGSFLESRFKRRRTGNALVIFIYALWRLGHNFVLPSDYDSLVIIEKQALNFVILALSALCFYKVKNTLTAFLAVTFMAVSEISFFLAYMVIQAGNKIFYILSICFERGYISSAFAFENIIKCCVAVMYILLYTAFTAILYSTLKKITHCFHDKSYPICKTELLFILAPSMTALFISVLLRIIIVTVQNGVPALLYDKYPLLGVIVPLILILCLLSVICGVKLFQDMICLNRERNSRIVLEKQIAAMQEHIRETERVYSGVRRMKHDMKNNLSVIIRLASEKGEKADTQMKSYIEDLNKTMDRLEFRFKTGSAVADTLLNMKYYEAARAVPDLLMDTEGLMFSDNLLIKGYDIGIILGNALDNAIEAVKRLKEREPDEKAFIRLSSFKRGNMLFLEIENSFDGSITRSRYSELPVTCKSDGLSHGMGLLNIKNAAEKYHGAVEWQANGRIFTLSVMLQNERGK